MGPLSLTFSQPQPTPDLFATPYYCLHHLHCIDPENRDGGKNYVLFRNAISRLAAVTYRNDHFFDPIRGEHRDVGFGFLSYSLPLDPQSRRAWRFAWDPIFFEFCQATGGALRFDFKTYRSLDPACRRLYLLLKKIFWRNDASPEFDLRDLAINVIGFSPTQETCKLRQKVVRCINVLLDGAIIRLPEGSTSPKALFTKHGRGQYRLRLFRGPHFDQDRSPSLRMNLTDSPLYQPLQTIGLDHGTIRRVLRAYAPRLVAEIADMTLAAKERNGQSFFKTSPQAYFIDNLQEQAAGRRTSPDWWRELRKQEEQKRRQADQAGASAADGFEQALDAYLQTQARDEFARVIDRIFHDLKTAGQPDDDARRNATYFARTHLVHRFRAEHPEWNA